MRTLRIHLALVLTSVLFFGANAALGLWAQEEKPKEADDFEKFIPKTTREAEVKTDPKPETPAEPVKTDPTPAADVSKKDDKTAAVPAAQPVIAKRYEKEDDDDGVELVDLYDKADNTVVEGAVAWKHNRIPNSETEARMLPIPDRWRIGMPQNPLRVKGNLWNPYRQNVLKADYPILGQNTFLAVIGISDTVVEERNLPTPGGVSHRSPGAYSFFGDGNQLQVQQNFILSVELFGGESDFKPRAWEVRATPVFNVNYLNTEENFAVNIDPRKEDNRLDHQIAFQELFGEYHWRDISPNYDFISTKFGIQFYNNDFRGFLFADNNLGARVFGTYESNRLQFNMAYFEMLNKDTNSGLNTLFQFKDEHVLVGNVIRQDTFIKGYDIIGQVAMSIDEKSLEYNQNGVIVRPAPIGSLNQHSVKVGYLGFGGNGHIGRMNIMHQYYMAFGKDSKNQLAGREQDILAHMFALEASVDVDWSRFRASYFYASGDKDPTDNKATGFDSIFDNPDFAGGQFSYWTRNGLAAGNSLTLLKSRFSLLPNLSTTKDEGQANFVNPGLHLYGLGYDAELLPHLRASINVNQLQFDATNSLELLLGKDGIDRNIGTDFSLGMTYRPLLNQQIVITGGIAGFRPGQGFKDLYETDDMRYSGFMQFTVSY